MRITTGLLLAAAWLSVSLPASAALTDSEKAQIQGFIRTGQVANAVRVRALVARPDLSRDEAAEPLSAGFAAVTFDDQHEKFTRELLLGTGSLASRSDLAPALVRALLARASAAIAAMPTVETGSEAAKSDRLAAEVVRIHRFVDDAIANAGHPPPDGHDASAGFRDDSLKATLDVYRQHLERHAPILKRGTQLSASLVPVRAQAALTVVDLARGVLQRHEVSALLGLSGAEKALFERHGTLVEDGGTSSPARLEAALGFLDAVPAAADGLSLWLLCKAPAVGLGGRGAKAVAKVSLGTGAATASEQALWLEDVEPSKPDRQLAEVAYSAAWIATRAAFAKLPALRALAVNVTERAAKAGALGYLAIDLPGSMLLPEGVKVEAAQGASAELFTAHALRLVLLDAPRALDAALARATQGRDEPLAALMLALSVLAATSETPGEIRAGKTNSDGSVEKHVLGGVKLDGVSVSAFSSGDRKVSVTLASDGRVERVRVNEVAPRLSQLPSVRFVPRPGDAWMAGSARWEKLSGAPNGVGIDDGRFVLAAAEKSNGFDAVVTGEAAKDQTVHSTLMVKGRGGGLLVRGQPGAQSYDGIGLLITLEPSPRATLVLVDGKAHATELGSPVELGAAPAEGWATTLSVRGQKVSATVGDKKLEAKLTRAAGEGRPGLIVAAGGRVDATGFGLGPFKPAKKRAEGKVEGAKKRPGTIGTKQPDAQKPDAQKPDAQKPDAQKPDATGSRSGPAGPNDAKKP
jgi:hypothetical protein